MSSWREQLETLSNLPGLSALTSMLRTRADIQAKIGTTFGGDRKHYECFGWPVSPDYNTYLHLYQRGGIAQRVVKAYPDATWNNPPTINEDTDKGDDTQFEASVKSLAEKRLFFHYLLRADILARLGTMAILFIGYNDGLPLDQLSEPVGVLKGKEPWEKVLYFQPYGEDKVRVQEWETDPSNERFGKPRLYQITINTATSGNLTSRTVSVHHSRVLHVAENVLDDDNSGLPALEVILNLLLDLEKVVGSGAESFFQQSQPMTVFKLPPDVQAPDPTATDSDGKTFQDHIEDFVHKYKRYLVLQGMEPDQVKVQIADPTGLYEVIMKLIGGTTGIPKRILEGSERGELSSEQDETAWNNRVSERQNNWAEPFVLRPFLNELIGKGVLPPPAKTEYSVSWQESRQLSGQVLADIAGKKTEAIAKYASAPGAADIVPPDIFLQDILGFDEEVIDRIKETRQQLWDKDLEDAITGREEPEPDLPIPPGTQPGVPNPDDEEEPE